MKLKTSILVVLVFGFSFARGADSSTAGVASREDLKAAFSRYLEGGMSKSDFAAFCHRQGLDMTQKTDARYQALSGAFRCYMELGEIANARDVVVTMMDQKLPRQDILDLLRESNIYFGVTCFDYGCPQILDSIYRAGKFFRPTDISVTSLGDLAFGPLKAPLVNLSNRIETVVTCLPLSDRENGALICTTKCVRVNVSSLRQTIDGVKLYLTPKTEEVFQMEFLLSRPSYVREKEFERQLEEMIDLLSTHFSVDMSLIRLNVRTFSNRENGHSAGEKDLLFGDGLFHDSFEIERINIGDYGVVPIRINGSWYEDAHHYKFVRIRVADSVKLAIARRESESRNVRLTSKSKRRDELGEKIFPFYSGLEQFGTAALDSDARREVISRELGARGCQQEPKYPDVMFWWYERAAEHGNPMAKKWLADNPEMASVRSGRKSIYGIEISKVSPYVCVEGTGWTLHCDWENVFDERMHAYDDYTGAKFGFFFNDITMRHSGIVLSGFVNLNTSMAEMDGLQVAMWENAGVACTYNGLLVAGYCNLVVDNSVCNGCSMSLLSDFHGTLNGMQVSWTIFDGCLNGVAVSAYGSGCGTMSGLQVSCVTSLVLDKLPIPDWLLKVYNLDNEELSRLPLGDGVARGVQISGILNYVGGKMYGVQIGAVNYAKQLSGVQIGIANLVAEGGIFFLPLMNVNF